MGESVSHLEDRETVFIAGDCLAIKSAGAYG